jgi:hypothetical protein
MRQIEDVKKHLVSALREVLLALSSSLDIANAAATEKGLNEKSPLIETFFSTMDTLITFSLKQLPESHKADVSEIDALKTEVFNAVLCVINDEIDVLTRLKTHNTTVQIEALDAIRRALISRINSATPPPTSPNLSLCEDELKPRKTSSL